MSRKEKLKLIETKNPLFVDISAELFSYISSPDDIITFDQI